MRLGELEVRNDCGLRIYKVIYPDYTTFSVKNLKNAVNFHPDDREPCKNSWSQDLRSTHIRNKRLLDLPRKHPKCCTDIYNIIVDRQKLKKLQKYGLSRPVRTMVSHLEVEKVEKCKPEIEGGPAKIIPVNCVQIPESDSEEEDEDEDDDDEEEEGEEEEGEEENEEEEEEEVDWLAECERRCSECYTIEKRPKMKIDWRDLVHGSEKEYCKRVVRKVMEKYKGRFDAELKLKTRS